MKNKDILSDGQNKKIITTLRLIGRNKTFRVTLGVVFIVVVFWLGVDYGNGQIQFGTQNNSLPDRLNYSSVNQVYDIIKNNFDGKLTATQLLNGIKSGLASATGDPYTEYFSPGAARQFNNELQGSFSGIGAELSQTSAKQLQIISPIKGSPAEKAGLKPNDIITAINGVSTSNMTIDQAASKIRGPAGTKVNLQILRGLQQLDVVVTRSNITVPSVTSKILPGNIGYIGISQFSNDTGTLALQAANKLKQAHVKGIILDLRGNPGGEVSAAINVSSLWLPANKLILKEKKNDTVLQTYYSTGNDILYKIPTVVLINGGTASAAEITTAALHDNGAAYIIGQKSFGKGVVQEVFNLPKGAEIKVTIAGWYRPNGQNINHKGIIPDKVVPISATDIKNNQDPQLSSAINYIKNH